MKWLNPYRAAAIIIVIVGTALLMLIGKQHLIVVENTPYEIGGATLESFDTVIVKVSEKEELEIYEDESDYVEPVGPFYTLRIEIPGERGGNSVRFEKKIYLGYADRLTVNIPQLAYEAGIKIE